MKILKFAVIALSFVTLFSCGIPENKMTKAIPRVSTVDVQKYLGKWYEIVRMPAPFEDGLDNTTATYSLKADGKIDVLNEGTRNGVYEAARGVAWIPDASKPTELRVSFFFLVNSGYYIIELDEKDYQYAVVTSDSKDYIWILSRTPKMDEKLFKTLFAKIQNWGFDTSRLVYVKQN